VLVFFFFFNGLSFHLSAAFASHLLGFKMSWGSTTKEIKDTNFFKEVRCWAFFLPWDTWALWLAQWCLRVLVASRSVVQYVQAYHSIMMP
jgi:hypothetical protein